MVEPGQVDDSGWRIRAGVGLLADAPMSPERREAFRREEEREARALAFEEEQRRDAALERVAELQRQGVVPHSIAERLAAVSVAPGRGDRVEARREREAAEALGKPPPRFDRWQAKKNVAAFEKEREVTPATQADLRELQNQVTGLKSVLHALKRKRR
jgi:hypothetical protein